MSCPEKPRFGLRVIGLGVLRALGGAKIHLFMLTSEEKSVCFLVITLNVSRMVVY
jgi:hypothetical protein